MRRRRKGKKRDSSNVRHFTKNVSGKTWTPASGVVRRSSVSRGQLPFGTTAQRSNWTLIASLTSNQQRLRLEKLSTTIQRFACDISKSNRTNDHKGIPREPLALLRISYVLFFVRLLNESLSTLASNASNRVAKRTEKAETPASC